MPPQIPVAKSAVEFPAGGEPSAGELLRRFSLLPPWSVGRGKAGNSGVEAAGAFTGGGGVAAVAGAVLKPGGGVGGGGWRKRQPQILKKCGGNSRRTRWRRYESGATKSRQWRLLAPVLTLSISPQFAFFLACG